MTIAQAFHWLDPVAALPEIGRVLRPGGSLGLIWTCATTRHRSACVTQAPEEREKVLAEVGRLYDAEAGEDGLVLPYVTDAHRAVRL